MLSFHFGYIRIVHFLNAIYVYFQISFTINQFIRNLFKNVQLLILTRVSDYCAVHIIAITSIIIGESLACYLVEQNMLTRLCVSFLSAMGLYIYAFYIVNLLVFLGSYVKLHCANTSE
jgi:hypothetical protein